MHKYSNFSGVAFLLLALFSLIFSTTFSASLEFYYGQHFPNGASAVEHIYSPRGTWKSFTPLNYQWNYYPQYATPEHPFDKEALIRAANGSVFYTARDANGYLLCDPEHDLEINPTFCQNGTAFHEHNSLKAGGIIGGTPFTQFWFDDNVLATFMSVAYQRPQPHGLVEQTAFVRWQILGGDTRNWSPYNQSYFDTLALDGLFYLAFQDVPGAILQWEISLLLSGAIWNSTTNAFDYPGLHENYHVGLWAILTQFLLDHPEVPLEKNNQIRQHSVSLRQFILSNQEVDEVSGELIGWISNIGSTSALINTESIACNVLALGANAKYVFEFDKTKITAADGKYALLGVGSGPLTTWEKSSPGIPLRPGPYNVKVILRAENYTRIVEQEATTTTIASFKVVKVSKSTNGGEYEITVVNETFIQGSHLQPNHLWSTITLHVEIPSHRPNDDNNFVGGVGYDFIFQEECNHDVFGGIEISAVFLK